MAQTGRLVVCGDAGDALGDSIYEARLYVRGTVAELGADCVEKEMRDEHVAEVRGLLERAGTETRPGGFRRYARRVAVQVQGRQRGVVLMTDPPSEQRRLLAPGLRESATFDRNAIHEIQRAAARASTTSVAGAPSGASRISTTVVPGREHVALPARGLSRALRHQRRLGTRYARNRWSSRSRSRSRA